VPQCVSLITGLVDARSPRDFWRTTVSDYGVANVNIATSGAVFGGPSSDEKHGGGFGASVLDRKHPLGCCHCARSIRLVNPLLNGHSRRMTYLAAPESLSTEKSPSNNRANCSRAASAVCPDNTDNVCERTRAKSGINLFSSPAEARHACAAHPIRYGGPTHLYLADQL
jgi:hypothetical protein